MVKMLVRERNPFAANFGWISVLFHPFLPIFVWYHSNCFEVFPKRASRPGLEALGAGDGLRTRDPLLGKQLRYHCATPAW